MIKTVLLAVIGLCCGLIGVSVKNYLKKRKELFDELVSVVERLKHEIVLKKNYLGDIVSELNLSKEIYDAKDGIENGPFLEDEKKYISKFFYSLGKSDVEGEADKLADAKLKFMNYQQKATNSFDKNGKLSVKLGALFGIAIFLIFL